MDREAVAAIRDKLDTAYEVLDPLPCTLRDALALLDEAAVFAYTRAHCDTINDLIKELDQAQTYAKVALENIDDSSESVNSGTAALDANTPQNDE